MLDIFKILYLLSIKKVTTTLKSTDWFIVSRQISTSPVTYESVAIKKEDLISSITADQTESIGLACSDLTTAITTGTNKAYYDIPYNFTISEVICTLLTAQASGSIFTVNVLKNGTTIFSTAVTIDNGETSSLTAATAYVLSTTALTKGDRLSVSVTQVGNGTAAGLITTIVGKQTT